MKFNVIDLFCGAGGMSEGVLQAGLYIIYSSDINESVEKTYRNRHTQLGLIQGENTFFRRSDIKDLTGEIIYNDIKTLTSPLSATREIDAIFGGPPCQGFSRAGLRNSDDPRNLLFAEYIRLVSELMPKYVVIENVEGFMDMQFFNYTGLNNRTYKNGITTPEILKQEFIEIGYSVLDPKILNAADYGVPQRRRRVIFIAYRNDVVKPEYPEPSHLENPVTLHDAISDLSSEKTTILSEYQKDSIRGRTKTIFNEYPIYEKIKLSDDDFPNHSEVVKERFSLFLPGESTHDLRSRIKAEGIDISTKHHLIKLFTQNNKISEKDIINKFLSKQASNEDIDILLTKKNIRSKLDPSTPSPTVVTIPDDYISPYDNRTFSVRELARLQSFDDSFSFLGKRTTGGTRRRVEVPQYTQVGNAVPPLLARAIASEIKIALKKSN